jgi:DnaJ-class molecular chaperone|tara:strand:- start:200 stop:367 length:168 start_codon:yes stop_codon:yes gene_type:complete
MSKIGNYVVGLQEASNDCPECKGYGQVEVQITVDEFRDEDCENCNGTGKLEGEEE